MLTQLHKKTVLLLKRCIPLKKERLNPTVVSYMAYGTSKEVIVLGRVVEEFKQHDFTRSKNRLIHFIQVVKLFITYKYSNKPVDIQWGQSQKTVHTNGEGFFRAFIKNEDFKNTASSSEEKVHIKIKEDSDKKSQLSEEKTFSCPITYASEFTKMIVISDIDDTVMKSKATSFLKLVLRTLFIKTTHRKTFPEAADFYNKMSAGESKNEENLFFYVSSSTWNIYPLLDGFLKINDFPQGVLLLQDIKGEKEKEHEISHGHKLDRINEICSLFKDVPLTLIGDAGQKDPEIYLKIAEQYPQRIHKILIRNKWWSETLSQNEAYLERAQKLNIDMHYFDNLNETNIS